MKQLADALIEFFERSPRPVVLHEPSFTGNEQKYTQDCIETGWVSSAGSYVDRFAKDLEAYTGAYAVPVMNGTAALHLSLLLAGVQPQDEVLVPDITFVATANAVQYCYAVPHFMEVEEGSFAVDPEKLRSYLKTMDEVPKYMLLTHIFGMPAPVHEILKICEEFDITLIEDAAESLGTFIDGKHTGTFGKLAALSFNGNKIMTTGGGGVLLTTDKDIAGRAKHLSTTAKTLDPYTHFHDEVGYNYRMPNLNAALGCAQLEQLPSFLKKKELLAKKYEDFFRDFDDVSFIKAPENSNNWLNTILAQSEEDRNSLIDALNVAKIFCRGLWAPMSALPMYKDCPKMDTSVAYDLWARAVNLPSSSSLIEFIDS